MSELETAFPRITIEFCTQCKWMLRAAYFAQELLSTFSTSLGEVALQPSTGGTFVVHLYTRSDSGKDAATLVQKHLLWDRKAEGGFPETKELKRRVRDIIDPTRNLGHIDSHAKKAVPLQAPSQSTPSATELLPSQSSALPPQGAEKDISLLPTNGDALPARNADAARVAPEDEPGNSTTWVEEEDVNGKVVISGGEGVFFCRPGDEDCG